MIQIVENLTLDALDVFGQLLDSWRLGRRWRHRRRWRLAAVGPCFDGNLTRGDTWVQDRRRTRSRGIDPF